MVKKDEASVKLEPVRCRNCQKSMASCGQDMFFYCDKCKQGFEVRNQALYPVKVEFKKYRGDVPGKGKRLPFWTFGVKLTLHYRESTQTPLAMLSSLTNLFSGKIKFDHISANDKLLFYVPAYRMESEYGASPGFQLTMTQARLQLDEPGPCEEIYYDSLDAAKLADYIFLSSEVEKPDVLSRLKYSLDLINPMLVIVKFV